MILIHIIHSTHFINNSETEVFIKLENFTPKNIPGLPKHNDLQRYGFIHLDNEIDMKSFYVDVLRPWNLTKEENKVLETLNSEEGDKIKKEGKKPCHKFRIPYKIRNTPFKVERNDSELTMEYYTSSVNDLDLESTQKQSILSYLTNKDITNKSKGTFIIISIEWFNFMCTLEMPVYYRINLTDMSNQNYRSKYFSVFNSVEIDTRSLWYLKALWGFAGNDDFSSYRLLQKNIINKLDAVGNELTVKKPPMFPLSPEQIRTFEYTILALDIDDSTFHCTRFLQEMTEEHWAPVFLEIYFLVFCIAVPILVMVILNRRPRIVAMNRYNRGNLRYV